MGEGHPHSGEFYLQELYQVLTISIGEKYPVALAEGRGKELFQNKLEYSAFLNKTGSQEKLF